MIAEYTAAKKFALVLVLAAVALLMVVPAHAQTLQASTAPITIGQVTGCNDSQLLTLSASGTVKVLATVTYASGDVHDGWLYVKDTSTNSYANGTSASSITVTVNNSLNLQIGLNSQIGVSDQATVTLTTPAGQVINIPVSFSPSLSCQNLTASDGSISVLQASMTFNVAQGMSGTLNALVANISANPVTIAPAANPFIPWISVGLSVVTIQPGQTVAIPVTVSAGSMAVGTYGGNFAIGVVGGPTVVVQVTLNVLSNGVGPFIATGVQATPSSVSFTWVPESSTPGSRVVAISNQVGTAPITFAVAVTQYNGPPNWLLTNLNSGQTPAVLTIGVNTLGLYPGVTYQGTVTITPLGGPSVEVNVSLAVTAPPVVTASPTSLTFNYTPGNPNPPAQTVVVSGGGNVVSYSTVAIIPSWLSAYAPTGSAPNGSFPVGNPPGGAYLNIMVNPTNLAAGTYTGTVTVYGNGPAVGSTNISVTLIVAGPKIKSVASAASYTGGPVAPGEMITLFADSSNPIGPDTAVPLSGDLIVNNQLPTSMGGVQVVFLPQGVAAPLIYVSATQINCVVPYEVAGGGNVQVQVKYRDQATAPFGLPTAVAQPAIFTSTSTGSGQGAVGQYDGAGNYLGMNSVDNPVARGNVITLYVTGEGAIQNGVTGRVTSAQSAAPYTPQPQLTPSVLIDGQPATITFYGEVPGVVAGMMQVNVVVPRNVRSAPDVPVSISLGTNYSQAGVTIAAK